jgi:predicted NBD/HSP70 family sugar kinase
MSLVEKIRHLTKREKLILKTIFQHKQISRPELMDICNLKIATLYRTIDSLISNGLAVVAKPEDSACVGRPSDLLSLNGNYGYVYCIIVRRYECSVAIVSLAGDIMSEYSFNCSHYQPKQLIEYCHSLFPGMIGKKNLNPERLLGVSISTFGEPVYSSDNGTLPVYPGFRWNRFDYVSELRTLFNKPVFFEYNARSSVMGYYLHKYSRNHRNMAYVIIDEGIGIGIIIDGNLIRGSTRIVNGLGHMVVDLNGLKCICGKYGCMETKVSTLALLSSAISELKLGKESILQEQFGALNNIDSYIDVCRAADAGDKLATYVVENAAHIFSIGLENFLNILEIDLLVIGGGIANNSRLFCDVIKRKLSRINSELNIEPAKDEKAITIQGCSASFIFDHLE